MVEGPVLSQLAEEYRDRGVVVLGVNVDPRDTPERIKARTKSWSHQILVGGNSVMAAYGARGTPTTFYIDRSGILVARHTGLDSLAGMRKKAERIVP